MHGGKIFWIDFELLGDSKKIFLHLLWNLKYIT